MNFLKNKDSKSVADFINKQSIMRAEIQEFLSPKTQLRFKILFSGAKNPCILPNNTFKYTRFFIARKAQKIATARNASISCSFAKSVENVLLYRRLIFVNQSSSTLLAISSKAAGKNGFVR